MNTQTPTQVQKLERTPFGTFVFEHNGMSIHDPMSSDCGRFRFDPFGDGGHSPLVYGFEVVKFPTDDGTAWERVFEVGGVRVVMRVSDENNLTHEVEPGDQIRVEVSTEQDEQPVAVWYQREGALDDTPPRVVFAAPANLAGGERAGSELVCPNCGTKVLDHPETGCVLQTLIGALAERGTLSQARLLELHAKCEASSLWDRLAKIVDDIEAGDFLSDE